MRKAGLCIVLLMACSMLFARKIGEWRSHLAYNNIILLSKQGDEIFAVSDGSLFSVNVEDGRIECYDKQSGMNGSKVCQIAYNAPTQRLLIAYSDGMLDIRDMKGDLYPMLDLREKDMSSDKAIQHIQMYGDKAYCSMSFGVMVVDMRRREVADSYYIGSNGEPISVWHTTLLGDSIYAATTNELLAAGLSDNLSDYRNWHSTPLPSLGSLSAVESWEGKLYLLQGNHLFVRDPMGWKVVDDTHVFTTLKRDDYLYCIGGVGLYHIEADTVVMTAVNLSVLDVVSQGSTHWVAAGNDGLANIYHSGDVDFYHPDGPIENTPYRLKVNNGTLYMVPGGRWAVENKHPGNVMIYDGTTWTNITNGRISQDCGCVAEDFMNVAVDPTNPSHFFVTSYGEGVFEFENNTFVKNYTYTNSPLKSAVPTSDPWTAYYVRADGAMYDDLGNLCFLNAGKYASPIHVASPQQMQTSRYSTQAQWDHTQIVNQSGNIVYLETPLEMFQDNRKSNYFWVPLARSNTSLVLMDNNSTPHDMSDDKFYQRDTWKDQDGNQLNPEYIYCVTQDREGDIWIGTKTGLFLIPSEVDFRTSNACERIKIPRNDGTNLADYLLGTEMINAIAVDGSNRKWIATESSGLYLMSEDGMETIEHFTAEDSPLLSNKVISLAIDENSGLVYVGTDGGLMSYQSDATEPMDDFSSAYAYPNPVRPDYDGVICIKGLMEESTVKIVDAGGNLVYETISNGGMATWSGRRPDGRKVASGVYTAFCHSGNSHQVVKILVMH